MSKVREDRDTRPSAIVDLYKGASKACHDTSSGLVSLPTDTTTELPGLLKRDICLSLLRVWGQLKEDVGANGADVIKQLRGLAELQNASDDAMEDALHEALDVLVVIEDYCHQLEYAIKRVSRVWEQYVKHFNEAPKPPEGTLKPSAPAAWKKGFFAFGKKDHSPPKPKFEQPLDPQIRQSFEDAVQLSTTQIQGLKAFWVAQSREIYSLLEPPRLAAALFSYSRQWKNYDEVVLAESLAIAPSIHKAYTTGYDPPISRFMLYRDRFNDAMNMSEEAKREKAREAANAPKRKDSQKKPKEQSKGKPKPNSGGAKDDRQPEAATASPEPTPAAHASASTQAATTAEPIAAETSRPNPVVVNGASATSSNTSERTSDEPPTEPRITELPETSRREPQTPESPPLPGEESGATELPDSPAAGTRFTELPDSPAEGNRFTELPDSPVEASKSTGLPGSPAAGARSPAIPSTPPPAPAQAPNATDPVVVAAAERRADAEPGPTAGAQTDQHAPACATEAPPTSGSTYADTNMATRQIADKKPQKKGLWGLSRVFKNFPRIIPQRARSPSPPGHASAPGETTPIAPATATGTSPASDSAVEAGTSAAASAPKSPSFTGAFTAEPDEIPAHPADKPDAVESDDAAPSEAASTPADASAPKVHAARVESDDEDSTPKLTPATAD